MLRALWFALLTLSPLPALACATAGTGAGCVVAPPPAAAAMSAGSAPTPALNVGAVLGRGEHSILLNAEYYGLPPVSDGWVYMRVERDVYRVDWRSHEVLERVTDEAAANF
jgi:hypothetical protein